MNYFIYFLFIFFYILLIFLFLVFRVYCCLNIKVSLCCFVVNSYIRGVVWCIPFGCAYCAGGIGTGLSGLLGGGVGGGVGMVGGGVSSEGGGGVAGV